MTHPFSDPALKASPRGRALAGLECDKPRSARLLFKASTREETVWGPPDRACHALPVPREGRTGAYSRPRFRMGLLVVPALSDGHGGECLRPRSVASRAFCINTGTGGGYA